jgi:hypothetical protein
MDKEEQLSGALVAAISVAVDRAASTFVKRSLASAPGCAGHCGEAALTTCRHARATV